ncbi:MAG: 30S ribosome-binding factor RbfA [Anaerolineae bacterium]|nr:30S ribosome-binding factor RbfA [Anaerolineae bacterium]
MVSQGRAQRIAQRIKEELSEIMLFEVTDPRLSNVFVTTVRVDRELSFASIFVSALEGEARKDEILEGMVSAEGFLRRLLVQKIQLRSFPRLRFNWDASPEYVERIDRLIASLHDETAGEGDTDE